MRQEIGRLVHQVDAQLVVSTLAWMCMPHTTRRRASAETRSEPVAVDHRAARASSPSGGGDRERRRTRGAVGDGPPEPGELALDARHVQQIDVPISTCACSSSCVTCGPRASRQAAMKPSGGLMARSPVARSTRRYSSSTPRVRCGRRGAMREFPPFQADCPRRRWRRGRDRREPARGSRRSAWHRLRHPWHRRSRPGGSRT